MLKGIGIAFVMAGVASATDQYLSNGLYTDAVLSILRQDPAFVLGRLAFDRRLKRRIVPAHGRARTSAAEGLRAGRSKLTGSNARASCPITTLSRISVV